MDKRSSKKKGLELPAIPPSGETISFMAIKLEQNGQVFYLTSMMIDVLFPSCFVLRREEDPTEGFQRHLAANRVAEIAEFLDGGFIPGCIILSAQEAANLQYSRTNKSISFSQVAGAFMVIDGQHRLSGYQRCIQRHRVPVVICEGLGTQEQVKLFMNIHDHQKGVPSALLADIKHLAGEESPEEQQSRTLFDRLSSDDDSPLKGKLNPAGSGSGKISRIAFNRAMKQVLASSVFTELPDNKQYQLIVNYIIAFNESLRDKSLISKTYFFSAMFEVFDDVVHKVKTTKKNLKPDSLLEIAQKLANHPTMTSSKRQPKTSLAQLMRKILNSDNKVSEDDL